jgi:hypothetical protein
MSRMIRLAFVLMGAFVASCSSSESDGEADAGAGPVDDGKAPEIVGEAAVSPAVLKKGAVLVVSFEVSEGLGQDPVVTLEAETERALVLDESKSSGNRFSFSYEATGDEPQGTACPIEVSLTDPAGSKGVYLIGTVKFDFIAPTASQVTISGSPAKMGGVVMARFSVSEPLVSDPVVLLALEPQVSGLKKSPDSKELDYVYAYTATGVETEAQDGVAVAVDLTDLAGNEAKGQVLDQPVIFDFTAPALAGPAAISPAVARYGSLVAVTFETTEDLGADPIVEIAGKGMVKGASSGRVYTYTHVVEVEDGEGLLEVTASLSDRAGNAAGDIVLGQVALDFTVPVVINAAVEPAVGRVGTLVTATFESSEMLAADPVVKAGSLVFSKDESSTGTAFSYGYTLGGTEPEGVFTVTADIVDAAGNTSAGVVLGTFAADFSAPVLVNASVAPAKAKAGDVVTLALSVSEALASAPLVSVGGAGSVAFALVSQSGNVYSYGYTVNGTEAEGQYDVAVSLVDVAGNQSAALSAGSFVIDFTP